MKDEMKRKDRKVYNVYELTGVVGTVWQEQLIVGWRVGYEIRVSKR